MSHVRRSRVTWLAGMGLGAALVLPLAAGGAAGDPSPADATIRIGAETPVAGSPAAPPRRPNILFITTDDQRADEMWVLDHVRERITRLGANFKHAYANFPLCCPARATFQTGQYAHNHGVLGNLSASSPVGGYPAFHANNTIATWLDRAGYNTSFVGKYLNGYGEVKPISVPAGWDDWHANIAGGNYYDTTLFENGTSHNYRGRYETDVLADVATALIERDAAKAAPFFLYASFYAPHNGRPNEPDDPAITTPAVAHEWRDHYAGLDFPRSPSFDEVDVSDKPSFVRSKGRLAPAMQAQMKEAYEQRLESLESVDTAVNRMLNALSAAHELSNTLIIFTSDNGYLRGEHRLHAGKTVPYEPSSKIPLVIRGPGIPAGVVRNQMVGHIDLAPTMARAAGVTPSLKVDGIPLQPLAASPKAWADRAQVLEAGPQRIGGPFFYRGVRTPGWVYVDYGTEDFYELYNLRADPDERRNLAYLAAYQGQRAKLARLLAQLRDCAGSTCR